MFGVKVAMLGERAKSFRPMACSRSQQLDQLRRRWEPLHHSHEAKERDWMVVKDPVVLGPDEARDGRRRHPRADSVAVDPECLEVAEQVVVVAALLVDVLVQV